MSGPTPPPPNPSPPSTNGAGSRVPLIVGQAFAGS